MNHRIAIAAIALTAPLALLAWTACSSPEAPSPEPEPAPSVEPTEKPVVQAPTKPTAGLVVVQARFDKIGSRMKPKPATMVLYQKVEGGWHEQMLEDPSSNVFHKGMVWRDGILTIGGMKAQLTHWTRDGENWTPKILWEKSWGGKFDRLRDIEIADVTGDGKEDLVLATHDMGVVAVGTEGEDGSWSFAEMDKTPDTFVHEIEIGDVDGDGVAEFYATPSDRNKSSGASQPGSVSRYDFKNGKFVRSWVVQWEESHAKEILVTDVDGDGKDELYAVREAHVEVTKKPDGSKDKNRIEPVKIVRMDPGAGGKWTETVVATLEDDQCRFLLPGDVNHDGKTDLIAAGKKSGLWLLEPDADGGFDATSIDEESGGYEHASHVADLDGDGKQELYVAADDQRELREYTWDGHGFKKSVIRTLPPHTLTWNIQDGVF